MLGVSVEDLIKAFTVEELAKRIDHAVLKPSASMSELERAIRELENYDLRCLILTPTLLREARNHTRKCLGAVVGFPFGYATIESKVKELEDVIGYGADEADIVANTQALLLGKEEYYINELKALIEICKTAKIKCKIIIETPILNSVDLIAKAVELIAKNVEPDYIKTSTGFADRPTYPEDVVVIDTKLRRLGLRDKIGIKASGGIRTAVQALTMLASGADILGASKPVSILEGYKRLKDTLRA